MSCPFRSPPANTRRSFICGRAFRRLSSWALTRPATGGAGPTPTASFSTARRAGCGSGTLRRRGVSLIPGCPLPGRRIVRRSTRCQATLLRRERRHQPGPAALRLLHDARHILDEEKPRSRERLGVTSDEVHIPRSVAVALRHARARIAAALTLHPVARKRDEGSVEVHELVRVGRAATEAPWCVCGQRGYQLQAPDTAQLVAVDVHLGDTRGERLTEAR